MLVFASPVPAAFSGLGALQSRHTTERPSVEEQYFQALAEEHERAAALARQRVEAARRRQQQQREVEAQLLLQQQLAAVSQVRTPQRSPYHTPSRRLFGRALPPTSDVILEFDASDNDACDAYAERMHRRSQAALLERQKRAQQQEFLRSLFEEQRRTQAEKVAELHRKRVEEAKLEQERRRKAQEEAKAEQARRHLAARAADEEKLRQFFQALVTAMGAASTESQGADLERKNAVRRSSVPVPARKAEDTPAPVPAPASAPTTPKLPERAPSPAPSVASDASDVSLNSIALLQGKYESLRSSFTFPSELVFAPAKGPITPASAPTLLYNPTNAPVHAYENALTNLLTELDAVESFGDEHVRDVRRSLVKSVEAELEVLEEKKREAWRNQQETNVTAPAPAESTPTPAEPVTTSVESAPVTEPEVESAPRAAESESTATPTADSLNPVSWLASRLSEAPESEDEEVKAVRENLLASLSTSTPADETIVTESQATEPEVEVKVSPAATESPEPEVVMTEPSEPVVSVIPEPPVEPVPVSESLVEPVVELAPEPEVIEPHTSTSGAESTTTEPETEQPAEQESPVAVEPASSVPETEPVLVETVPETEVTPASPVESEPVSVFTPSEPEVIVKDETPGSVQVESNLTQSKSETEPEAPVSTKGPNSPIFVQVYPDSDSDIDTDADLTSEMGEADKKSGDEFELI
ncbi:hypothetical protein OPQ81_004402 [Rhizoctonia solani]|nr:hypothetical protein OPQ81_004402 [Rhizoctonia solani]